MRLNKDNETVRAMDILFPGIGEIVGGSQREESYDILLKRMHEFKIEKEFLFSSLITYYVATNMRHYFTRIAVKINLYNEHNQQKQVGDDKHCPKYPVMRIISNRFKY